MISANELRIGNYIESKSGKAFQTQLFHLNKLEKEECNFYPISITEEWLKRFGFVKNITSWVNWERPNLTKEVRLKIQGKYLFYDGRIIEHVHLLQNLYFALTGQELE
jgi:hypothetical protein